MKTHAFKQRNVMPVTWLMRHAGDSSAYRAAHRVLAGFCKKIRPVMGAEGVFESV